MLHCRETVNLPEEQFHQKKSIRAEMWRTNKLHSGSSLRFCWDVLMTEGLSHQKTRLMLKAKVVSLLFRENVNPGLKANRWRRLKHNALSAFSRSVTPYVVESAEAVSCNSFYTTPALVLQHNLFWADMSEMVCPQHQTQSNHPPRCSFPHAAINQTLALC